jgi:hypothetical protein
LLVVAPFSQYDLVLLDILEERLAACDCLEPIYVANLQDYKTIEHLNQDIPGITITHPTPILAACNFERSPFVSSGKKARDFIASVVGIAPDELLQRINAEAPSYNNTMAQRTTATSNASQVERWLAHLGPGSRSFWRKAAEFLREHESFTFDELARYYEIPMSTLRSFHRNSYRAIRNEDAPDPLSGHLDDRNQKTIYKMTNSVRDLILELTRNDSQ